MPQNIKWRVGRWKESWIQYDVEPRGPTRKKKLSSLCKQPSHNGVVCVNIPGCDYSNSGGVYIPLGGASSNSGGPSSEVSSTESVIGSGRGCGVRHCSNCKIEGHSKRMCSTVWSNAINKNGEWVQVLMVYKP